MDEQSKIIEQVERVIERIKKDTSYQNLLIVQREMRANQNVLSKIEQVKQLQQKYVKSKMQDEQIKHDLQKAKEELESIPLYQTYLECVSEVDSKLRTVESILNAFFMKYIE